MSTDVSNVQSLMLAHFEPPSAFSENEKLIYGKLIAQIRIVTAFYSFSDVHLQPLEVLSKWLDALCRCRQSVNEILPQLHGAAQKTWNVANAINTAIFPVYSSLLMVVDSLKEPHPLKLPHEKLAEPFRARLGELGGTEFRPLLDELAIAISNEGRKLPELDPKANQHYVTLDQMAAMVNKSKKTLERAMNHKNSTMPPPDVEGGGGVAHEWKYDTVRPWLEEKYKRKLPEKPPTLKRS